MTEHPHPLVEQVVELPLSDLQLIRAALNSAFHYATVVDLAEGYRKLTQRPQSSTLTKALQNALTLSEAYIEEATAQEATNEPE